MTEQTVAAEAPLEHLWYELMNTTLGEQWLSSPDIKQQAAQWFKALVSAYEEAHRSYHTLEHIASMLNLLNAANIDDVAAHWAVWFHDYIYQPGAKDNESLSAAVAQEVMESLGVKTSIILRATAIILATKSHLPPVNSDEAFKAVLDADMAILGSEPSEFQTYSNRVRAEFRRVPTLLYKIGRRKFLRDVLQQPRIFHTEWFFERFEQQARANLLKALK
ncbi:hypothetical protein [Marinibactrum halimedae]|uniref:Metal-dependent HD superfamily phosphohydrolase n=1 Tax=Marinibactrum halimedae TaxID=1444977 RepID=A0AA37T8Y4_9GAMM|nr:hypothetical protein [Marinibactrum halimedae]MCD9459790.1 hypothetical protein [Marinibactrum halimedae]GLS27017.1 hypothetical protein GCM10007877_27360 [Marinibactrum halimedae]